MHRVLIVDDSDIFRRSLRAIVGRCTEWEICGEARDAEHGTRFAQELKPDVIVMDFSMPGISGIEAIRRVRSLVPNATIVVLSLHESRQLVKEILEVGACGYVVKPEADSHLIDALNTVLRKEIYISPGIAQAPDARA